MPEETTQPINSSPPPGKSDASSSVSESQPASTLDPQPVTSAPAPAPPSHSAKSAYADRAPLDKPHSATPSGEASRGKPASDIAPTKIEEVVEPHSAEASRGKEEIEPELKEEETVSEEISDVVLVEPIKEEKDKKDEPATEPEVKEANIKKEEDGGVEETIENEGTPKQSEPAKTEIKEVPKIESEESHSTEVPRGKPHFATPSGEAPRGKPEIKPEPKTKPIPEPAEPHSAEAPRDKPKTAETPVVTPPVSQPSSSVETKADKKTEIPFRVKFLEHVKTLRQHANLKRSQKVEENLNKILEYARDTQKVTNDDVERLTGIKHVQSTRYLNMLVKDKKLVRFGVKSNIFYKPVNMHH